MNPPTIELTANVLIKDRIPSLILGVNRTKKEAWHRIYYLGRFGSWDSFEKDVRKAKLAIELNDDILGYQMNQPAWTLQNGLAGFLL
jgi:hypothetical protein